MFALFTSLLAASAADAAGLNVAWDPPSDGVTTGYIVWYGTAPGAYAQKIDVGMVTSKTISNLADQTTYYFAIQAYSAAGDVSPLSAEAFGTTPSLTTNGNRRNARAPKPPKTVTAALTDSSYLDLSWQPSDDPVAQYRIEVGTASGRTDVSSFTTGSTTHVRIGDLPFSGTTYYVRVRSINPDGVGDPSPEIVVAPPGGRDAPQRLTGEVLAGPIVRLTWDPPVDAAGVNAYVIEAGTGPGRSDLASLTTSARTFTSPPVPNGTYFVRIRALRITGPGSASNEVILQVGTDTPCQQAPGLPTFDASALGTLVQLTWAQGSGDAPTGYVVDVGSTPGLRDIATLQFDAQTTSFTAPAPNGTYAFRVTAVNACGASQWAAESTVTIGGLLPSLPGAPVGLTQTVVGRSVTLNWSPPVSGGDAARFVVEASDTQGNVLVTLDTGNLSTSFIHGDVPPGEYVVRIKAANAAGIGPSSNAVTVTVR
jgi:predicted phage tail protein